MSIGPPQSPESVAAPSGIARQATVREFLAVLFRRKWVVIGLFVVTTATVLSISLTAKTVYQSAGRVLVKRGDKESVLSAGRQVTNQWEEELGSEMEIVKSQPVLDMARQKLAALPGTPTRLNPLRVDTEVLGKSNVMAIVYIDPDPQVAQRCAQAVIDAYMEFRQNNMTLSYPKQLFNAEITQADADLRRLTEERRAYAAQQGVIDLDAQRRSQLALLQTLEANESQTAAELAQAQSEQRDMRLLETRPEISNPTAGTSPTGQDPIMEVQRRIIEQEARLADLHERYRDDAIEVTRAESTLATLQGILRREVTARLEISQTHITALTDRLHSIQHDIAQIKAELESMPDKEARLSEMDVRLDALKRHYADLVEKSGSARITEFTSEPVKLVLLSPASTATPRNKRDYVRIGLAPAFSVVVGIGLAFFIDGLDITVRTAGHAEEASELPVLATVNERRRRRAG